MTTMKSMAAAVVLMTLSAGCSPKGPVEGTEQRTTETAKPATPAAPPPPLVLAEGTKVVVRTTSTLSTKSAESGQTFAATLQEPLEVNGQVIAPKGAEVTGKVVESDPGGRVKGVASISVRLTTLKLANGKEVDLATSVYEKDAPGSKKKDAVKVGIGSGVGAAIGAIAGGGRGAAIGAAAGAGAGTGVVMATRGDPAVISSETVLSFKLTAPVTIPR
jgi:predicted small lipoprotein YifL